MPRRRATPIDELLAALPAELVAELLAGAATRHPDVEHAIRLAAARATGDVAAVAATVDAAMRAPRKAYLGWGESTEWARGAQPAVDELAAWAESSPSAEFVALIERAIGRTVKVLLKADDSGGAIGDVARELLEIHARTCDAGVADPVKLGRWIVRFRFRDQDFLEADPARYAVALGERGLAIVRKAVDEHTSQSDFVVRYFHERLAIVDRDPDAIVRHVGRELHHSGMHLAVARAMAEIDRPDLVLEWAMRGIELEGWPARELYDLACRTHVEQGAPLEALRLRRAQHERAPTPETYRKLRAAAESVDAWTVEQDAARAALRDVNTGAYVQALLADGDDAEAWGVAAAAGEPLDDGTRVALADRRAATHPADALAIYLDVVDTVLEETGRQHYAQAIRLLRTARDAARAAGCEDAFDTHVARLRDLHPRRPALIAMLEKVGL